MAEASSKPAPRTGHRLGRALKRWAASTAPPALCFAGILPRLGFKPRCALCLFEYDKSAGALPPQRLITSWWAWSRLTRRFKDKGGYYWHLDTSSPPRCASCAAILDILVQANGEGHFQCSWILAGAWSLIQAKLQPKIKSEPGLPHSTYLELYRTPGDSSTTPSTQLISKRKPQHPAAKTRPHCKATARDAVELANSWLQRCLAHHTEVCDDSDPEFSPTRLLSIGDLTSDTVLLVDNVPPSSKYATLSHRWSEETDQIKLLRHNFQERLRSGITLSALPRMFRDVIDALRQLRFEYVWIDCLCIIQDSENDEDWRHEAARMGSVYRNSTLTIAATGFRSCRDSLFPASRVPAKRLGGDDPAVFIREHFPHFITSPEYWSRPYYDSWPLLQRGWVYQERMLSPRVLHFTQEELVWECSQISACECTANSFFAPGRFRLRLDESQITATADIDEETLVLAHENQQDKVRKRITSWTGLVHEFTSQKFTFAGDRVPALASIARAYGEPRGWTYLCGIWKEEFLTTFAWSIFPSTALQPRVNGPFPTWSWGAVANQVWFYNGNPRFAPMETDRRLSLKNHQIEYLGDVYVGQVKIAKITLAGAVFPATLLYGRDWEDLSRQHRTHMVHGLKIGEAVVGFPADYLIQHEDEHFIPSSAEVVCLILRTGVIHRRGPYNRAHDAQDWLSFAAVLVLYRSDPSQDFKRIGWSHEVPLQWVEDIVTETEVTII